MRNVIKVNFTGPFNGAHIATLKLHGFTIENASAKVVDIDPKDPSKGVNAFYNVDIYGLPEDFDDFSKKSFKWAYMQEVANGVSAKFANGDFEVIMR